MRTLPAAGIGVVPGSGIAAAASLRASTLGLYAPPDISDWMAELFVGSEGGKVEALASQDDLHPGIDLLLVVNVPGSPDPAALFAQASLLGIPALSLPVLADEGLPLGLQVAGFVNRDADVFAAAAAIQVLL